MGNHRGLPLRNTEGRQAVETCHGMSLQSKIRIPQSLIPAESSRHCAHRPVEGALSVDVDVLEFVVVGLSVAHLVVNVL